MTHPTPAELIHILSNAHSVRSVGLTEKRIDVLLAGLRCLDAELIAATRGLLEYTGGWDITDTSHPIYKARIALDKAEGKQ